VQRSIFGTPPKEFTVNYLAHEGQQEISAAIRDNFASAAPAAIVEIIASRGWGKTLYLCAELLAPYMEAHPNAKVMWVAPTYNVAMSPIEDVFKGIDEETGKPWVPEFDSKGTRIWEFVTTKSGPVLKWYNGATCTMKSADSPDSIVSRGYNLIIIDEAALIEERVFTQQILGTARKAGIKIFMISTPRGKKHWTYKTSLRVKTQRKLNYYPSANRIPKIRTSRLSSRP
jgi:phage terminase large subunit-like protein